MLNLIKFFIGRTRTISYSMTWLKERLSGRHIPTDRVRHESTIIDGEAIHHWTYQWTKVVYGLCIPTQVTVESCVLPRWIL